MTDSELFEMEQRRSKFDVQPLVAEVRKLQAENAALKAGHEQEHEFEQKSVEAKSPEAKPPTKGVKDAK